MNRSLRVLAASVAAVCSLSVATTVFAQKPSPSPAAPKMTKKAPAKPATKMSGKTTAKKTTKPATKTAVKKTTSSAPKMKASPAPSKKG